VNASLTAVCPAANLSAKSLHLSYGALDDAYSRQIRSTARRFFQFVAHSDDLMQAGRIALWQASQHFDSTRGIPFEHYARRSIRRAVAREARVHRRHEMKRVDPYDSHDDDDDAFSDDLDELADSQGDRSAECVHFIALEQMLAKSSELTPAQVDVLELRYVRELTQAETAAALGVTQQRVSQLEACLLTRLRAVS
jgi:RNA polymerase sporulation-specific sigma factor